jgi:hypothetical protein
MTKVAVDVLRSVRIADGDPIYGREIVKGTSDEIPAGLLSDLKGGGFVIEAGKKPTAKLREDGPTVAEYVASGYLASNYPPKGYASRSTAEEIAAAVAAEKAGGGDDAKKAEEAAKARAEHEAELNAMTVAQLKDLAEAEQVVLEAEDNKKAEIIAKIVDARLAKPAS